MTNYKCKICGDMRDSRRATIMHLRKKHGQTENLQEGKHYEQIEAQSPKQPQNWRRWQKHPDGSRQFKFADGQWIRQKPGEHFLAKDKKKKPNKKPKAKNNAPQVLGIEGTPQIHSDGIIINVLVKIPLSFGLPVIVPPEIEL